ncbi:MAG TPA: hypothetical protein PK680_02205 [Novosphingobium sp.]|nr:hypothetical protein [Novosphingobium sp.]HQA17175.1 hypothetical protein [Novosphingobium sp.]
MTLFSADLYKSFAIGFVVGGIALAGVMSAGPRESVIPQAQASTVLPDQTLIAPSADAAR